MPKRTDIQSILIIDAKTRNDLERVTRQAGLLTRGQDDATSLETMIPVGEASFASACAMMRSRATAFQSDYTGWECAMVTN